MNRTRGLCSAFLLAICCLSPAHGQEPSFPAPATPQAIPGEFIVKLRPGTGAAVSSAITQLGGNIVDILPFVEAVVVRVPDVPTAQGWVADLGQRANVESVEPHWRWFALETTPNDASFSQQWGLPKIRAPQAWDTLKDSPAVVVAVIDTGIDYNHPDLQSNMWKNSKEIPGNGIDDDRNGIVDDVHGANFVPASGSGVPLDDHNHGSHVAGIISAVTNNSVGIAGTSWKTQLMAVKFLGADGSGNTANAIRAIEYATLNGAHIMNNSWGGGGHSPTLETAIRNAHARGILFVAAAGNNMTDTDITPHYPSGYDVPNVVSVLATDPADKRAAFSNWGKQTVDLGAPGTGILSTIRQGQYISYNGTSMATPFVAGVAALVKAAKSPSTVEQLKKRLMDSVDKIPELNDRCVTGGRLNLERALQ